MIRALTFALMLAAAPAFANQPAVRALPMDIMGMAGEAPVPETPVTGTLRLGAISGGGFQKIVDLEGSADNPVLAVRALPDMEIALVSDGHDLIPLNRGIRTTTHPYWDYIVEPGKTWMTDEGETVLSLPFALIEKNANCIHNGVLMAWTGKDGAPARARVQIASETCLYFKFNLWAEADAAWQPEVLNGDAAIARWHAERATALPVQPASALAGIDLAQPDIILPGDMTAYGAVVDGVHYTSGCNTRFGAYPYCDVMPVPSYSFAKTFVGGLGLMRLEAFVPDARERLVVDLVPECSAYEGVTLGHLLDMATGHYRSEKAEADEAAADYLPFFLAASASEKTAFACGHFPRRAAPGTRFSYHTSDTWLLGVAMQALWRQYTGEPDADFYADLMVPLWRKLGLSALAETTRRLDGIPFTGYGLVLHTGDIAKLAHLMAAGDKRLAPALSKGAGLPAGDKSLRYSSGFWQWDAGSAFGCGQQVWLPFLSGYGGLSAVLLPDGGAYYYISDSGVHRFAGPVKALATKAEICGGTKNE
ncbi:hypothetical protein [Gimibacter soli]|uniref:Beta-lactamase-related domain-containing protein n=1 Tax=Gimibacter soli TaxID=3024400 RepID=A0AAE9XUI9_9PROT|nr:hypothetical protein [Gimibacter soli]WCL55311.1 hypothetical protein PH603_06010 [Gimibacter soli]